MLNNFDSPRCTEILLRLLKLLGVVSPIDLLQLIEIVVTRGVNPRITLNLG